MILSGLKPNEIASASGLSNFFRTIAASISTAVTVTMWQHRGDFHHATLAEHINDANPATQQFVDGLDAIGAPGNAPWAVIEDIVNREALTLAVNDVFLLYAGAVRRDDSDRLAGAAAVRQCRRDRGALIRS